MRIKDYLYTKRARESKVARINDYEAFASDRSRIIFCSSFRRMMQKAQVFSLEQNTSVRNRLTHSLEVADVGKSIARNVGYKLKKKKIITDNHISCIETITENACLLHDIGNPPFGHFGESAIKQWFFKNLHDIFNNEQSKKTCIKNKFSYDMQNFDGNPQGFRIVTTLHAELDEYGLNLTDSTLLASIKYPCCSAQKKDKFKYKKLGIFSSESEIYKEICDRTGHRPGQRYFLSYLMELADDICYCLSDIADAIEKRIIERRLFVKDMKEIIADGEAMVIFDEIINKKEEINSFTHEISIPLCRRCIESASAFFTENINDYLKGNEQELSQAIPEGKLLSVFKTYARKKIYTEREVQRIEIAGHKVVWGLLEYYGALLKMSETDFKYFCKQKENSKNNLDMEWRIFNQLSERMLNAYHNSIKNGNDELCERCRLIVDYVSGMTDQSALHIYQNAMGISL